MSENLTTCRNCGSQFQAADRYDLLCGPCVELEARERFERNRERNRESASEKLREIVSPRMQATNRADPRFNVKAWDAVKGWRPTLETPWLGLIGPTGKCKSRIAHEILAGAVIAAAENGDVRRQSPAIDRLGIFRWSIASISATSFADLVRRPQDDAAAAMLDTVKACRWLVLDDLGKSTHTPAVSSALFGLLDHRQSYALPTIWTANNRPEIFLADMKPDLADPLRGRLLEFSTIFELR